MNKSFRLYLSLILSFLAISFFNNSLAFQQCTVDESFIESSSVKFCRNLQGEYENQEIYSFLKQADKPFGTLKSYFEEGEEDETCRRILSGNASASKTVIENCRKNENTKYRKLKGHCIGLSIGNARHYKSRLSYFLSKGSEQEVKKINTINCEILSALNKKGGVNYPILSNLTNSLYSKMFLNFNENLKTGNCFDNLKGEKVSLNFANSSDIYECLNNLNKFSEQKEIFIEKEKQRLIEQKEKEQKLKAIQETREKQQEEEILQLKKEGKLVDGEKYNDSLRWSSKRNKFYSCGSRGDSIVDNGLRLCMASCYYQSKPYGAADYTLNGIWATVRESQSCPLSFKSFKESELSELGANWY
jgi:hypothetical protein